METLFWTSLLGTLYAYFLYPGVLYFLGRLFPRPVRAPLSDFTPTVSLLMPVHNEAGVITSKLQNLEHIDYPRDRLRVVIVSDGSTDETVDIIGRYQGSLDIQLVEVVERRGKAHALNTGLQHVTTELVVFSDASILLENDSLKQIVRPFQDPSIGCVSGEDHIAEGGGEGLYGQYELFLRNQESALGSIVGASGSFYAQRMDITRNFEEGLAPDFLSVLNTVAAGYRAITEPAARGHMRAVRSSGQEFQRKVRTLLRGMTALFDRAAMLNPFKYGLFSLFLISHKLMRWLVPLFLLLNILANISLLSIFFYQLVFAVQLLFYAAALLAYPSASPLHRARIAKIPLFFVMVNIAIAVAWLRYLKGDRQELWTPSQRGEKG